MINFISVFVSYGFGVRAALGNVTPTHGKIAQARNEHMILFDIKNAKVTESANRHTACRLGVSCTRATIPVQNEVYAMGRLYR
jgi:hypothetical protein